MLSMDDTRWAELKGGYRTSFDLRPLLTKLETEEDVTAVWKELWDELHHQGDVDEASYAAIPHIVRICCNRGMLDWNAYAVVSVVELARTQNGNPDVPGWLKEGYFNAIHALAERGISDLSSAQDPESCRAILSVIALKKGLRNHASMLIEFSDEELDQIEFIWKK
jgi:hypothetical protein